MSSILYDATNIERSSLAVQWSLLWQVSSSSLSSVYRMLPGRFMNSGRADMLQNGAAIVGDGAAVLVYDCHRR